MLPLDEARKQLTTLNAAISDLIAGKRLTSLRIGSGNFQREYKYQEITLETLEAMRQDVLQIIYSYEGTKPVFRTNASIPLLVGKDLF